MLMELPSVVEKHPQLISRPLAKLKPNAPIYMTSRILLHITVPGIQKPAIKKRPMISSIHGRKIAVILMSLSGRIW
jgi:hypothetical protein